MKITLLLLATLVLCSSSFCQPNFLKRLQKGQPQHLVVYGTSLSSGGAGNAWMRVVSAAIQEQFGDGLIQDRKSTRLNSSHVKISYAVFCLKKKNGTNHRRY